MIGYTEHRVHTKMTKQTNLILNYLIKLYMMSSGALLN